MHDVVIIGGGPAGSTAATLLSRRGRSVVLLERERFPRFQIGESLLPYNNDLFDELGVRGAIETGRFVRKPGAVFVTGDGTFNHQFRFALTQSPRYSSAYQVRRAEFDSILLDKARESGADVREGWRVGDVDLSDPSLARIVTTDPDGERHEIEARMLVDASGSASIAGVRVGRRFVDPSLRKVAVFAHYRGVLPSAEGEEAGNIVIVILRDGWLWMIPLSDELTSVGLVVDREVLGRSRDEPAEMLDRTIAATPYAAARMSGASLAGPVHARKDFSFEMEKIWGSNFVLVGDAAGFIDPIFSTGVLLAMKSAALASDAIETRLADGSTRDLRLYERTIRKAFDRYRTVIERFYRREFIEVFLHPQERFGLVPVVISLLAGNVFSASSDRWKMGIFYALVAIQKWLGVVAPRVSWDTLPSAASAVASEERFA